MKVFVLLPVLAVVSAGAFAATPARPELVAKVAAGELKEARASWWGWNGEDDTAALQAAIDSGVPKLVVDRMDGAWVVKPIFGRGEQTIVFEKGVEMLAKRGEFRGGNDSLFCYRAATNVTLSGYGAKLRMHRMDYHNPPYRKAEWRHGLSLLSCVNFKVEGLTIAESGGDGIYVSNLAKDGAPCKDVVIRDCVCDKNYRQGISVISVDGLLIENTVMRDTWGTPPAAGIDFEPNKPSEMLRRCVMRNCVCENNQGAGYEFYLGSLEAGSLPVDAVIENCRSFGNGRAGFTYSNASKRSENFPTGLIQVRNCAFERDADAGIRIAHKPTGSVRVEFIDCSLKDCCAKTPNVADVRLFPTRLAGCDNVLFKNLKIQQSTTRPWLSGMGSNWSGVSVHDIRGNVEIVDHLGGRRELELNDEWLNAVQGNRPAGIDLKHVEFSAENLTVVDAAPGEMRELRPVRARDMATYLFYAEKPRRVNLNCRIWNYGNRDAAKTASVKNLSGGNVAKVKTPAAKQWGDMAFDVPAAGFYRLVFDLKNSHSVEIRRADVPLALEGDDAGQAFISSASPVYVYVRPGKPLALQATGSDGSEFVHVVLSDPAGNVKWDKDPVDVWTGYAEQQPMPGLWKIKPGKPNCGHFEDFRLDVLAQPCVFFLSSDRYWK